MLEQAIMVLDRNRELAERRPTELGQRLSEAFRLNLLACEFCRTGSLSAPTAPFTTGQLTFCGVRVHIPVLQQQAARARLPVRELAALGILHEQERCLRHAGGTLVPFTAEQRLARKLHRERLFDLLYVQAVANRRDWQTLQQATAILREHHELAPQRHRQLRRLRLNQTGPLHVKVCHNCFDDHLAEATSRGEGDGVVDCNVRIDMARTEADARAWNLPLVRITALMLVHEQEHCIQHPNRSQTPAVESEQRLARKLGDARLYQFATH